LDPNGSGESAMIIRYELGQNIDIYKGYMSAFSKWEKKRLQVGIYDKKLTHLLIHTLNPMLIDLLPVQMERNHSYLLQADDKRGWTIIKSWKRY
jgi:hypothetical protein